LFVTNDTGVMHLATGLVTPMIALFGPTQAEVWGPIGDNKYSLQSPSLDINEITVEKVFGVCEDILKLKIHQKT
jgi:ADP-heptose:LPS heptosyltransferase